MYSVNGNIYETAEEAILAASKLVKKLVLDAKQSGWQVKGLPGWYRFSQEFKYWDGEKLWKIA